VTKDTERSLRSIAKSLEQVVHLLKGDRPGVLKEPATIEFDAEALKTLADAVSEGIIQEEKEQE